MYLKIIKKALTEIMEISEMTSFYDEATQQTTVDVIVNGKQRAFVFPPSRDTHLYLMNADGKTIDSWCF